MPFDPKDFNDPMDVGTAVVFLATLAYILARFL